MSCSSSCPWSPVTGLPGIFPKLRGQFAEFLNNPSPVGLRILSSSTCVGLRYGLTQNNSGFSRQFGFISFPTLFSVRISLQFTMTVLPIIVPLTLHRFFHPRLLLSSCVPTVLFDSGTGLSTCYPSTTSFDLALGPDFPRADQLDSGSLRFSA